MHQYSALTNFSKHKPALRKHINFSGTKINLPKHKLVSRNTSQEYIIKLNPDYRNTRENRNTLIPGPGCTHSCAVAKAHLYLPFISRSVTRWPNEAKYRNLSYCQATPSLVRNLNYVSSYTAYI